jgi:hypothetical protein
VAKKPILVTLTSCKGGFEGLGEGVWSRREEEESIAQTTFDFGPRCRHDSFCRQAHRIGLADDHGVCLNEKEDESPRNICSSTYFEQSRRANAGKTLPGDDREIHIPLVTLSGIIERLPIGGICGAASPSVRRCKMRRCLPDGGSRSNPSRTPSCGLPRELIWIEDIGHLWSFQFQPRQSRVTFKTPARDTHQEISTLLHLFGGPEQITLNQ